MSVDSAQRPTLRRPEPGCSLQTVPAAKTTTEPFAPQVYLATVARLGACVVIVWLIAGRTARTHTVSVTGLLVFHRMELAVGVGFVQTPDSAIVVRSSGIAVKLRVTAEKDAKAVAASSLRNGLENVI